LFYESLFSGIPDVTEFYCTGTPTATLAGIKDLQQSVGHPMTACRFDTASINLEADNSANVTVVYTDDSYAVVYRVHMLAGSFRLTDQPTIVIGKHLADKLFIGTDIVGRTISLGGTAYTISGIFEDDEGFISKISRVYDYVYVLNQDASAGIPLVSFSKGQSPGIIMSQLSQREKAMLMNYTGVSLRDENYLAGISRSTFWILCAIALLIPIIIFISRRLKACVQIMIKGMENNYFLNVMRNNWKEIVKNISWVVPGILLIIMFFRLMPLPHLPMEMVPDSSELFNPTYYYNIIVVRIQRQNSIMTPKYYLNRIHASEILIMMYYLVSSVVLVCVELSHALKKILK
jgi:hypothetical protein